MIAGVGLVLSFPTMRPLRAMLRVADFLRGLALGASVAILGSTPLACASDPLVGAWKNVGAPGTPSTATLVLNADKTGTDTWVVVSNDTGCISTTTEPATWTATDTAFTFTPTAGTASVKGCTDPSKDLASMVAAAFAPLSGAYIVNGDTLRAYTGQLPDGGPEFIFTRQ